MSEIIIKEFDPSCVISQYEVGEKYWFIRNVLNKKTYSINDIDAEDNQKIMNGLTIKPEESGLTVKGAHEDDELQSGLTIKESGLTIKPEESGLTVKDQYEDENDAIQSGLTVKYEMNAHNGAGKTIANGEELVVVRKYGQYIKQEGTVVKVANLDGKGYLFVLFDGVDGVKRFKCPFDPSMYYAIEKLIESDGVPYQLQK